MNRGVRLRLILHFKGTGPIRISTNHSKKNQKRATKNAGMEDVTVLLLIEFWQ